MGTLTDAMVSRKPEPICYGLNQLWLSGQCERSGRIAVRHEALCGRLNGIAHSLNIVVLLAHFLCERCHVRGLRSSRARPPDASPLSARSSLAAPPGVMLYVAFVPAQPRAMRVPRPAMRARLRGGARLRVKCPLRVESGREFPHQFRV